METFFVKFISPVTSCKLLCYVSIKFHFASRFLFCFNKYYVAMQSAVFFLCMFVILAICTCTFNNSFVLCMMFIFNVCSLELL